MATSDEERRAETLRSIPIFKDLDEAALADVLSCAVEFEVANGHVLAQPNLPGEGLFVIEEGKVSVALPERHIELGPGEFFGELSLLTHESVHTGRVSAAGQVKCFAIRRDDFDRLLAEQPKLAISILRVVAERLADRDKPLSAQTST